MTVTVGVTVGVGGGGAKFIKRDDVLEYRQVTTTPHVIPPYATACSSAGEYISACNCWGISGSDTTVASPISTYTSSIDYCDNTS